MNRLRRTAAVSAATSLWLACGLAYAPVASAEPPTIRGAQDPAGAPALPDGDSVDTIGGGNTKEGTLHYRVDRPDLASTVFFGAAMTVPRVGSDGMSMGTQVSASQTCMNGSDSSTGSAGRGVLSSGANAMETCPQQPSVTARLERYSLDSLTSKDTPAPVLLRVVRVPAVTNLSELPQSLPKVQRRTLGRGAPGNVQPGTSITQPAAVKPDVSYTLQITTGTVQFFAVDVDWGQSLMVQADVAGSPDLEALKDKDPTLHIDLIGPALNEIEDGQLTLGNGNASRTIVGKPVVWRSYAKGGEASFLAGRHLVAVGLPEAPFGKPATLSYTLTVDVEGEVTGVPRFDKAQETKPTVASANPVKGYAALGLGIAGALMLIASGVVWLRSRA